MVTEVTMAQLRKRLNSMSGAIKIVNCPIQTGTAVSVPDDFEKIVEILKYPHLNRKSQLKTPHQNYGRYEDFVQRYDPTLPAFYDIDVTRERGLDKPESHEFSKKTSVSLFHPGRAGTESYYGIQLMKAPLGLLFDVNKVDPKDFRYVFSRNVSTNQKTTLTKVRDQLPPAYQWYISFNELQKSYVQMWQNGQTPPHWSEMLFCLNKRALIGIYEPKNHFTARMNALVRQQTLIKALDMSVPIIISNTQAVAERLREHYLEYTQAAQWQDIFALFYRVYCMTTTSPAEQEQQQIATALLAQLDFSMLTYDEEAFNAFKRAASIDFPNAKLIDDTIKEKILSQLISRVKMANNDGLLQAFRVNTTVNVRIYMIRMLQTHSVDETVSQCPSQIQALLVDPDFDINNYIAMQNTIIQQHGYVIAHNLNTAITKIILKQRVNNKLVITAIKESYKVLFKALKITYQPNVDPNELQKANQLLEKLATAKNVLPAKLLKEIIESPDMCKDDYIESCRLLSAIADDCLKNSKTELYQIILQEWKNQISAEDQVDVFTNSVYFDVKRSPYPSQLAVVLLRHNKIQDLLDLPKAHRFIILSNCLPKEELIKHDFLNAEDQQLLKQQIETLLSTHNLSSQQWSNLLFLYDLYADVDLAQQLFAKIQAVTQHSENLLHTQALTTLKKLSKQINSPEISNSITMILEHVNPSELEPALLLDFVQYTLDYPQQNLPPSIVKALVADKNILSKIAVACDDDYEQWTKLMAFMHRLIKEAEPDSVMPLVIELYNSTSVHGLKGRPFDIIRELLVNAPLFANSFIDRHIIPNLKRPIFFHILGESKDDNGFMFIHWAAMIGHEAAVRAWLEHAPKFATKSRKKCYLANQSPQLAFTWYYYHSAIYAQRWALLESLLTSNISIPKSALAEALDRKPQFSKAQAAQFPKVVEHFKIALIPSDRPKSVRRSSKSIVLEQQSSFLGSEANSVNEDEDSDDDLDMTSAQAQSSDSNDSDSKSTSDSDSDSDHELFINDDDQRPTSATAAVGQTRTHSDDEDDIDEGEDDDAQARPQTKRRRLQLFAATNDDNDDVELMDDDEDHSSANTASF